VSGDAVDTSALAAGDGWSKAVLSGLAGWDGDAASANLLLRHLTAAAGGKPAGTWLRRAGQLAAEPGTRRLLRLLIEAVAAADVDLTPHPYVSYPVGRLLVSPHSGDVLRAACWAAGTVEDSWVVPALREAALRTIKVTEKGGTVESVKVPNACIHSLGVIATTEAIAGLQALQRGTRHSGYRARIGNALAAAAASAGLSLSQLAEQVVPDAGLDTGSRRLVQAGPVTARIGLGDDLRVSIEWQTPRGWDPKAAPSPGVAAQAKLAARGPVKEVKAAVAAECQRLEELVSCDRSWPLDEWRGRYLGHPVTGPVTRRLIWAFETGGARLTGIPATDGTLRTNDGGRDLPAATAVRLWHPLLAPAGEVRDWRDHIVRTGERQPFRQAFRETYPCTPAELQTRTYSNRFAGHVLRHRQAYALFKERAWAATFLGNVGENGSARRDFPDAALTAVFGYSSLNVAHSVHGNALCGTDRVFFHRTGDRARIPVPLQEVPVLVFTEAMRDVDLFISVASIGLDPHWADHGQDAYLGYWQEFSFGELTEIALVRRDALARLLPNLKIATRLELTERFLRVRGRLHSYKIHLGSASILIEPDDRYLCIVPAAGRTTVMLPFDEVLTLILSKAHLLAADDKITDSTILSQLPPRP
jgi:hypothetical protein